MPGLNDHETLAEVEQMKRAPRLSAMYAYLIMVLLSSSSGSKDCQLLLAISLANFVANPWHLNLKTKPNPNPPGAHPWHPLPSSASLLRIAAEWSTDCHVQLNAV